MKLRYEHTVAILYTLVLFLDRLDLTLINIALPTLAHHFHISVEETDNVSLSFLLALAVSIPISPWLGDRFGLKRIYLLAIILFGGSASLCALAPNFSSLIFFRFIQGVGGGLLIPVGMTLLYRVYDKSHYVSVTSFTFIPSLIAPAIAPFVGGVLLDFFSWHSVFWFSGPICLVIAVCVGIILKKEERLTIPPPLDKWGFVNSAGFLLTFFYALSLLSKKGISLTVSILFCASFLFLKAFLYVEKRVPYPLIHLDLLKVPLFAQANLIQLCFQVCHFGSIFFLGMYLQIGIGMSASRAGLIMGMQAVGAICVSRYSVNLFNRMGPQIPLGIGLAGVAILTPCILFIQTPQAIYGGCGLFFLRGLFSGLCGAPLQTLSVIGFSNEALGQAASIFNICRQVAISLGVALSALLMSLGFYWAGVSDQMALQL